MSSHQDLKLIAELALTFSLVIDHLQVDAGAPIATPRVLFLVEGDTLHVFDRAAPGYEVEWVARFGQEGTNEPGYLQAEQQRLSAMRASWAFTNREFLDGQRVFGWSGDGG